MLKCPHCGAEVKEMRGSCEGCGGDLNAEGIRLGISQIQTNQEKTTEELEEIRKHNQEIEKSFKEITTTKEDLQKRIEFLENHHKERMAGGASDEKVKPIRFSNLVCALATDNWENAAYEREVIEKTEEKQRALSTGAIGTGAAIIPPEYLPGEAIDLLRASLVVESMGARVLDGLSGTPVTIPRLAGGAVVFWVAENAAKTPTDQTFEQVVMTPHEAAAVTQFSNRMLMLSNPKVDAMVTEDLLKVIALEVDRAALFGTGAGNQPLGVVNQPGITVHPLLSGTPSTPIAEDIDEIELALDSANALIGKIGWISHPRFFTTMKAMRDESGGAGTTTGGWLFRDDIKAGNLDGYKFGKSTQVPINLGAGANESQVFFANWDDMIVGYWGGIEVTVSKQAGTAFLNNQTWIRVSVLVDVAVRHPQSFVLVNGVLR